eukprot:gene56866-biopygen80012
MTPIQGSDQFEWKISISGPVDSPYEGGTFWFKFNMDDTYGHLPPKFSSPGPDLYGNTWRAGHDSEPEWGSVVSQVDIASGLWHLAHNDSGRGGYNI